MSKDLKELLMTLVILMLIIFFYFGLKAFIDYSVESSRKPKPTVPTYGIIEINELA